MITERIRIQFPISPANQLQLIKMIDTAMEKISRSFSNPLFHDVVIRQDYPIIETTYPPMPVSAYDQIQLQVYLHSHVVDAKISYLYMTAKCLDADLTFPSAEHGLNIPHNYTFLDETRSFLPFDCVGNVWTVPTLDKTASNTILSEAILAMRFDSLSFAKDPYSDYNRVTVCKGLLSFDTVPVSYNDTVLLSLKDLHIDKNKLDLQKIDLDWGDPTVFRSTSLPQSASRSAQDPVNVTLSTAITTQVASTTTTAHRPVHTTHMTASNSVHAVYGAHSLPPHPMMNDPLIVRAASSHFPSARERLTSRSYNYLTTSQQHAEREGLRYPKPYNPDFFSGNQYLRNQAQSIGQSLFSQRGHSRTRSRNAGFVTVFPLVQSGMPMSSDGVVGVDDLNRHRLPLRNKRNISVSGSLEDLTSHARVDFRDSVLPETPDVVSDNEDSPTQSQSNTVVQNASASTPVIQRATYSPMPEVPAASSTPAPARTRHKLKEQNNALAALILQYNRTATDIELTQVSEGVLTPESLFLLPTSLVEFGTALIDFMNIPDNRKHWYFINALPSIFRQQHADEKWIFLLDKDTSNLFEPCRQLDSAHLVLYDTDLPDPTIADTAQAFQNYALSIGL